MPLCLEGEYVKSKVSCVQTVWFFCFFFSVTQPGSCHTQGFACSWAPPTFLALLVDEFNFINKSKSLRQDPADFER